MTKVEKVAEGILTWTLGPLLYVAAVLTLITLIVGLVKVLYRMLGMG
jgi:hypothetical protein